MRNRYYSIKVGVSRSPVGKIFVAFGRLPTPREAKLSRIVGGGGKHVYHNPTRASIARAQWAQLWLLDKRRVENG